MYLYRKDFRLIRELRSLIPTATNVLACTATATVTIYEEVSKVLTLENPHIVALTPDRVNITYSVVPKQDFDEIVAAICAKLSQLATPLQFPKTVVFCQRYMQCHVHDTLFVCMYTSTMQYLYKLTLSCTSVYMHPHSIVNACRVEDCAWLWTKVRRQCRTWERLLFPAGACDEPGNRYVSYTCILCVSN